MNAGSGPGVNVGAFALLGRMIAETGRMADLFALLHEDAVTCAGGRCSVLLQIDPRTALLHPTSAFGIDQMSPDPWLLQSAEGRAAQEAFASHAPLVIDDLRARVPALAERLQACSAVLVPLFHWHDPLALLVVGRSAAAPVAFDRLQTVGHAFVLAIERARLQRDAEMQREVRRLLDAFARVASSALNLATGLEVFCRDATTLFAAERTSVWLHDRHARDLVLTASSDASYLTRGARVSIESAHSPAAIAMRRPRAEICDMAEWGQPATPLSSTITVPLKGRRRALGTLVLEGVRVAPGTELDLLDNADVVGRELSGAVENVQLLEEVLRSRREMEKTVNSLPDLIAVCHANLQMLNANQAFSERAGIARQHLVGRLLTDFLGAETTAWLQKLDLTGNAAQTTQSFTRELDDQVIGGRFSMTVSTLLGPQGDTIGVILVARDITPQARLEAERAALNDRLNQSEKLAALGQFVAGIAHELNNPLQAVLGHMELMRGRTGLPRELRREISLVFRESDRAAKIVRNLLVFAGRHRLSRRLVSVNTLVTKALATRGASCRAAGIEIVRRLDESAPKILADPLLLQQAILNIVINAEQAVNAKAGGRIEASTKALPKRNLVVIEIRDTGPGIPPDALAHVFEPFYTTKEVGKGTGLGLAITYGIIQEHRGQVIAGNHEEGGAVLTIELPTGRD